MPSELLAYTRSPVTFRVCGGGLLQKVREKADGGGRTERSLKGAQADKSADEIHTGGDDVGVLRFSGNQSQDPPQADLS